jgi:hypothetical protein
LRATLIVVIALLAACATEKKLAVSPPAGVDLSGQWKLNVADSDDPLRLSQALAAGPGAGTPGQSGGSGGRGGRGGRSGGSRSADPSAGSTGGPGPGAIPASTVAEVLRWPGAVLEIKQVGGVAAFSSDADSRVYQPTEAMQRSKVSTKNKGRRATGPSVCGWSGRSLVVQVEPQDDEPGFEARYQVSGDGQRLVQLITLNGGRARGFTMSRVWDREP